MAQRLAISAASGYTIMARASRRRPETANWNVLGYGNNGVREHAVTVRIDA